MQDIVEYKTSEYIEKIYRDYAIYVCETRAIPKVTDGLKDGIRKAHWILKNKSSETKTISIVGEMISNGLYLHGDAPAAEAISLAAAPYLNNIPLIEGIGNFGTKVSPRSFGAARYTFVKPSKYAKNILYVDLDLVPLKENYDGSNLEPVTFLPLIPVVLLNGISGIAVGWSTEILPRSLNQLIDAVIYCLEEKYEKIDLTPRYDYLDVLVRKTDKNSYDIYGKIERYKDSIFIKDLPPSMTLEKLKSNLDNLVDDGFIKDWIDHSSDFINVELKFKKGVLDNIKDDEIYKKLKIVEKITERIVVIDFSGTKIVQYDNPIDLVKDFVSWRIQYYEKRFMKRLEEKENQLYFEYALLQCFERKIYKFFTNVKNKNELKYNILKLIEDLNPNDNLIEKILNLPTYYWTEETKENLNKSIDALLNDINNYKNILNNKDLLKEEYKKEVKNLYKLIKNEQKQ